MGQILHGCARTTAAVRRAIQSSQESLIALAERYDINPKTVLKWRKRSFVADAPMGPKPQSTTLSAEQEAIIVAFRKHTGSRWPASSQKEEVQDLMAFDEAGMAHLRA